MTAKATASTIQFDSNKMILLFIAIAQMANSYLIWKTQQGVEVIHGTTNGMKDALVVASKEEGRTEGRAQEKEENPRK